jgi:N-acetylglucosamine-6-phosphate deacetylase
MDTAFRNFVQTCGLGVLEAVAAASTRPAELLGLGDVTGRIADGYAADLVLLDESLHPDAVMKGGAWV